MELLLPTGRESLSVRQTRHTPPKDSSRCIQIPSLSHRRCPARLCHMLSPPSRPETTRQVDNVLVLSEQRRRPRCTKHEALRAAIFAYAEKHPHKYATFFFFVRLPYIP
ncbi:hypothetical protein NQZ68_026611 [Dissostichus eleginoides]|nr:hypothetical protein NQZ68_026611 [Dissostichus eleginoides]